MGSVDCTYDVETRFRSAVSLILSYNPTEACDHGRALPLFLPVRSILFAINLTEAAFQKKKKDRGKSQDREQFGDVGIKTIQQFGRLA